VYRANYDNPKLISWWKENCGCRSKEGECE